MKQTSKYRLIHSQPSALSPQPCESGFTLVEVALVLMLLGALVVFGMTLVGPLTKKLKYNATKEIIQADVDGIEGWAYDGKVLPTSGTWATTVRNTKDSWTKDLIYVYDNNLTAVSTGGICGKKTTNVTLTTTTTPVISNAAFLVLSGSDDFNVDTNITGTPVSSGPIASATTITISDNDIVYWVTLDELRIKAGCKGAPLRIINDDLPNVFENSVYNSDIYAEGGVPFTTGPNTYKWCTTTAAPAGLSYTCSGVLAASAACSLTLGTWNQCASLYITGTVSAPASANTLTFYVKDNGDNITNKTLPLTINPCTTISVVNNTGGTIYYKKNQGACTALNNAASISSVVSDSTAFYTAATCNAGTEWACTQIYDTLKVWDANNNCSVRINAAVSTPTPSCTLADN